MVMSSHLCNTSSAILYLETCNRHALLHVRLSCPHAIQPRIGSDKYWSEHAFLRCRCTGAAQHRDRRAHRRARARHHRARAFQPRRCAAASKRPLPRRRRMTAASPAPCRCGIWTTGCHCLAPTALLGSMLSIPKRAHVLRLNVAYRKRQHLRDLVLLT